MDVPKQFLNPKLSANYQKIFKNLDERIWKQYQKSLVECIIRKRGIHSDELDNFNSYLPEFIEALKEHVHIYHVDDNGRLHHVYIKEAHFVLPYEEGVGVDDPERALLRENYEAKVFGTSVYKILEKSVPDEESMDDSIFDLDDDDLDDVDRNNNDDNFEENDEEHLNDDDELLDDEKIYSDEIEDSDENESCDDNDDVGEDDDDEPQHQRKKQKKESVFFIDKDDYSKFDKEVYSEPVYHEIFSMPVFVSSDICVMSSPMIQPDLTYKPYIQDCSFITSRNCKVCPYEETYHNNKIIIHKPDSCEIRSQFFHPEKRHRTNCTLKFFRQQIKFKKSRDWKKPCRFIFTIPHETPPARIPIAVLAMAYGWTPEQFENCIRMFLNYEITDEIKTFLNIIRTDLDDCTTQKSAINRISRCLKKCKTMTDRRSIMSYVSFTLRGEFLPNLFDTVNNDIEYENLRKGYVLAEATANLVQLSDIVNQPRPEHMKWYPNDLRSYCYKRLVTPGQNLMILARKLIKHYVKKASMNFKKCIKNGVNIDVNNIFNKKMIKLTNAVKNGIFDSKSDAAEANQHKTQLMITGFCHDSFHMQVQMIKKFAMKKNANPEPLMTHPTQTGRVDPYLTPETEKCGIIRFKALGAWITSLIDEKSVMEIVTQIINEHSSEFGWIPLAHRLNDDSVSNQNYFGLKDYTLVKDVYGGIIGWVKDPVKLYKIMLMYRRRGVLYPYLSMHIDRKTNAMPMFYFNCDEGRMMRPLIVMENLPKLVKIMNDKVSMWEYLCHSDPIQYLIQNGVVEYLDASEEYCGFVYVAECLNKAVSANFEQTHMEISQLMTLSITVCNAFCNHNQGPRRMYTGNMEKRSISLKLFEDRGTTVSHSLWYAQLPVFSDPVDEVLDLRYTEPNGVNAVVAIMAMGDNMEDALIMKKEAIERGMGLSTETSIVICVLGDNYYFERPSNQCLGKAALQKYDHILEDGSPRIGATLNSCDAVVGRVFKKKKDGSVVQRCMSKFLAWNESYRVKSVQKYPPHDPKIMRVSLVTHNKPNIGDKFFFKHGQKSTCGRIVSSHDLPFIEYGPMAGVSPDVIINVCALSRITQGLLLEMLLGQARTLSPSQLSQYDTVFMSESSFDDKLRVCSHVLNSHGLSRKGKYRMIQGTTGLPVKCEIFNGLVYMGVLKHMAQKKLRSRDRGPVNEMTKQTTTGRKNLGGLKFGEMENWNIHSYGMPSVFRDINCESADKFTLYWCSRCNIQCMGCVDINFYFCTSCKRNDKIIKLNNTYITNLAFQEMETAGFGHTFITKKDDNNLLDERLVHQTSQLEI